MSMEEKRTILRGQIYHVNLDPNQKPVGSEMWPDRPAIIVSNDINNEHSNTVEVVYLTTKLKRKFSPTHVKVRPLKRTSLAMCEQVHTVDKERLGDYIDAVSESEMELIDGALMCSLGITGTSSHVANLFHKWEFYINKYHLDIGMHLTRLFDAENNNMTSNDAKKIDELEQKLAIANRERDTFENLLKSARKKLSATEEECEQYRQLYEQSHT